MHLYNWRCAGMSIFRFSAEFRFFFFSLSAFLKMIFRFFLKITNKKFFSRVPTPPLSVVQRASVNSQWRLGLRVCSSSVSGRSSKALYRHSALKIWRPQPCCMLAYSVDCLDEGEGRVIIELKHLHPPPFPLSSLYTHTHTHTHTDIQVCQLLRFRGSMPRSVLACYTHAKNATVTYISVEFRFWFFFQAFRFFKNDFRFYEKSPEKNVPISDITSIGRVVNSSSWLGLPMCASTVSGRSLQVPYRSPFHSSTRHSKSDTQGRAAGLWGLPREWGGEGGG